MLRNLGDEYTVQERFFRQNYDAFRRDANNPFAQEGGARYKAREIQAACVHTLGNLTLTGYNSNLGNLPFAEKRDRKDSSGTYVGYRSGLNLNEDLVSTDSWSREQIEARTAKLVELAVQAFSFGGVEV